MYINMLSDYLIEKFGEKFYRISLNGGMSCPNRDGTCGTRGCLFCSESGAGEFTPNLLLTMDEQITYAKKLVSDKTRSDKYIAYFQSFSNTYAPIDYLRKLYCSVVKRDDIAVLSIATRPDCINTEVIELLNEINKIKPVWIELGLQTSNENTARFIRRGYSNGVYEKAVTELRAVGCKIITHLILSLPYENREDMINSARYAGMHSDGIKFHMLYITNDSDIFKVYNDEKINLLSLDEYVDVLCDCLRVIPESVVIHRLTGDGDKTKLVAPLWTCDKKRVLREINCAFKDRDINQGEYLI